MTDEQGNAVECKECADVPETPPSSSGFGWCPKVELRLDEPEATDEEMEEIDRAIDAGKRDDPHPDYGPCDALGPAGMCVECIKRHPERFFLPSKLDARLAADLEDHGSSDVLRDASAVLDTAKHLVNNGRRSSYGHPMDNFDRIRRGWEVILGIPISRRQVAKCQAWTKIARDVETETTGDLDKMQENAIDLCGYGALMEEVL